jgi:hypothetical protein
MAHFRIGAFALRFKFRLYIVIGRKLEARRVRFVFALRIIERGRSRPYGLLLIMTTIKVRYRSEI